MSALICHRSKCKRAVFVCPHCVHSFGTKKAFDNHINDCAKHKYQAVRYPKVYSQESILAWRSREKTERLPSVIYADFESCLVHVQDWLNVVDEHNPSGFYAYAVSKIRNLKRNGIYTQVGIVWTCFTSILLKNRQELPAL
jgi:hypothetical protein